MTWGQFSIQRIMVSIAAIAALLGAMIGARAHERDLRLSAMLGIIVSVLLLVSFIAAALFIVRFVCRQTLKMRLVIEFATLLLLLVFAAVIWQPSFYTHEEQRCEALARLASEATSHSPEERAALDRESAWFSRRASAHRWRGLWLGLTRGPSTRDDPTDREFEYQMGVLETNERHEKAVDRYSSTKRSP